MPGCEATIAHWPEVSSDAIAPETVQIVGVVEVNATGRPELALADKLTDVSANWVPVMGWKAMVC